MSDKTFVLHIICYIYYLLLLFIVVVSLVLSYLDKRGRCRETPPFGAGQPRANVFTNELERETGALPVSGLRWIAELRVCECAFILKLSSCTHWPGLIKFAFILALQPGADLPCDRTRRSP